MSSTTSMNLATPGRVTSRLQKTIAKSEFPDKLADDAQAGNNVGRMSVQDLLTRVLAP
jgi:hypothetical protein